MREALAIYAQATAVEAVLRWNLTPTQDAQEQADDTIDQAIDEVSARVS